MSEIRVIVIPAPDENGFSDKPYTKSFESEAFCSVVHSLLGDSCFDVVNVLSAENDMRLDAYVDDEGKLKGLEANNVFYDFSIS